jgi:hypothetical protein
MCSFVAGCELATGDGGDEPDRPTITDARATDAEPAPRSCADILAREPSAPDGEYTIAVGDAERAVYCDMTSDGGGWARAIDLDPTRDGCPTRWDFDATAMGCSIARPDCTGETRTFVVEVPVEQWREVRGYVRGYQFRTPDGFRTSASSLDNHYVDGVSITTGNPRRHLWTLGVGLFMPPGTAPNACPCDGGPAPPSFVGDQWTCETGNDAPTFENEPIWYVDDPLWDSDAHVAGCAAADDWFVSSLETPSADPIEVRIMLDQCDDGLAVTALRLFVR